MNFIMKNKTLISVLIAIAAIFSVFKISFDNFFGIKNITNNILLYMIFFGFYYIANNSLKLINKIELKIPFIFSFLLTLALVLGWSTGIYLTAFKSINIILFICLLPMIFLLAVQLFYSSEKLVNKFLSLKPIERIEKIFFKPTKKCFLNCFLFILLCHIPAFLAYFPGIFTYDVMFQADFFTVDGLVEIHPFLHNVMVYLILVLSYVLKSKFLGVLIYVIFQATIMFSIFAYCIRVFSKYSVNYYVKLFALLFFALYPMNHVFTLSVIKDTLFSGLVLLFVLYLVQLFQEKQNYLNDNKNVINIILTVFFIFCFRHNGIVAYFLFLPILIWFLKDNIKKAIIVFIMPLVLFSFYGIFKTILDIKPSPIATAIGIPLQQMGRVRKYVPNLKEQDITTFRNLVSQRRELDYFYLSSDNLRIDSRLHSDYIEEAMKTPLPYIKLWIKWGLRYPKEYVDAFLLNNRTYWYPNANYPSFSLHFFFYTQNRWKSVHGVEIGQKSYFPSLKNVYDDIFLNDSFEKYPIISSLFSMSVNIWLHIFTLFVLIYRKRKDLICPYLFVFSLYITLLFGPISLLRYLYFSYLLVPLAFAFLFKGFSKK